MSYNGFGQLGYDELGAKARVAELETFLDDDSSSWIDEHNAMKARIAAALALLDTDACYDCGDGLSYSDAIREALTN